MQESRVLQALGDFLWERRRPLWVGGGCTGFVVKWGVVRFGHFEEVDKSMRWLVVMDGVGSQDEHVQENMMIGLKLRNSL